MFRVETVFRGKPFRDQVDGCLKAILAILFAEEEEIRVWVVAHGWDLPAYDAVGFGDDSASFRLSVDY